MSQLDDPRTSNSGVVEHPSAVPGQSLGPVPRFPVTPRWVAVPNVPATRLPPVRTYTCRRAPEKLLIDGSIDHDAWRRTEWSEPFGRMDTGDLSGPATRVALLWDDEYLYAAWNVEDTDIRGRASTHHEQVYVKDDDVEIFVQGVGGYYEFGVNPINTVYEWRWTWVEPLVDRQDYRRLDELFSVADFVYYARRPGERMGRFGEMDWDLPGLHHAVRIDGTINMPADRDVGWTVTVGLPWAGLRLVSDDGAGFPPKAGDVLRIQSYRASHDHMAESVQALDGSAEVTKFTGYTWSTMGNHNVHNPERWAEVRFSDDVV